MFFIFFLYCKLIEEKVVFNAVKFINLNLKKLEKSYRIKRSLTKEFMN